nr:DUF4230 domain-containing protein [Novosphingobium piscinae]
MTPADPTRPAPTLPARPARGLRRVVLPWLLCAAAVGWGGWTSWQLWKPDPPGDPLATMLTAFAKQNRLTVFSAELAPVVASDDARLFGMLRSRQVAVIPARVDYTVDLAAIGPDRLRWDAAAQRLEVILPPLQLSRPNLDEGRAQYLREGAWITRTAQEALTRENTRLAETQAARGAANPALMTLARTAAREALRQNLTVPLQVAGYRAATITVRFDGEPAPR